MCDASVDFKTKAVILVAGPQKGKLYFSAKYLILSYHSFFLNY